MGAARNLVGIGVIGCGHWGPNHIRVFSQIERSQVIACADPNPSRRAHVESRYPTVRCESDYRRILDDEAIDAVVIATPMASHAQIARDALEVGKHVLVEKPLCTTSAEARALGSLAEARRLVLMVGHVFLFNDGIMKLRELIADGTLGTVQYLDAVRTNLGPIRPDVNALYDLGTHDISIFNYLMGEQPVAVSAVGSCITQPEVEDVCFVTLRYGDGALGHVHVSWLNPRKVRTLTVVADAKMAHWDDVNPMDTVRVYDKGLDAPPSYDSFGQFQCMLRSAGVSVPTITRVEPLVNQAEAFVDSVETSAPCRSRAMEAANVLAVVEAATTSMAEGGRMCPVDCETRVPVAAH